MEPLLRKVVRRIRRHRAAHGAGLPRHGSRTPAGTLPPEAGTAPAWLAFLCPAHSEALSGWSSTVTEAHDCGTVLDFRPTEQLLQSHAELWLAVVTIDYDPSDAPRAVLLNSVPWLPGWGTVFSNGSVPGSVTLDGRLDTCRAIFGSKAAHLRGDRT